MFRKIYDKAKTKLHIGGKDGDAKQVSQVDRMCSGTGCNKKLDQYSAYQRTNGSSQEWYCIECVNRVTQEEALNNINMVDSHQDDADEMFAFSQ